jgi:hypothetical protein
MLRFSSDIFFSYPSHFYTSEDKTLQNFTCFPCWHETYSLISGNECDIDSVGEQISEDTAVNRSLERIARGGAS